VTALAKIRKIGLYRRDSHQDYGLEEIRGLFAATQIELVEDAHDGETSGLDVVLAMGGDGTVLRAMSAYAGTPVLAVNYGSVGFLTQADKDGLPDCLLKLVSGKGKIEERLTLSVTHRGAAYRAINEIVIKATTNMIAVKISVDGRSVHRARGDGVIVGTPTGSTAYLMSTGAPIVVPDVDCMIIKPLNEYSISSRSLIVGGSSRVTLDIEPDREDEIGLAVDGGDRVRVDIGDSIVIERSTVPARLVYFKDDYFFRNLRERLGFG